MNNEQTSTASKIDIKTNIFNEQFDLYVQQLLEL